jgi:hypothetical protein
MKKLLSIIFFTITLYGCKVDTNFTHKGVDDIAGVYRVYMGKIDSLEIYIVDGETIRREIFPDFIFGGNEQRYPFVPHNEIWIDNSVSNREYPITLKHELNEMYLMRDFGMTYNQAHDSSLMIEVRLRTELNKEAQEHEKSLPEVSPIDTDSLKQITSLPDKIKLKDIYHQKREVINNKYTVWLVDGDKIRKEIYPDFGFNGDWYDYFFIPENEIWIDGSVSCEQYFYSMLEEINAIEMITAGENYTEAAKKIHEIVDSERLKMYNNFANKFVKIDRNNLTRDKGVKQRTK